MPDYVPALKAQMGDWTYYVTVMKLGKVARECRLAEEIQTHADLDNLIQRAIEDRVNKEMVPYLLKEKQRFYGALVVAVYGGDPEFSPVHVEEHDLIDDTKKSSYGFGLLRFDGSQVYYALDGQHRLKSIQEAIRLDADLAKEEISVIILKHEETKAGMQRTRRLFSTLNRRAKPTSAGMNIAIDEDDSIAIVTRRLVKENKYLKDLVLSDVESINTKQLKPTRKNDPYLTTLAAFYETNEILLGGFEGGLQIDKDFKQFRRDFKEIDAYHAFLENIWMQLLEKAPGLDAVLAGNKTPGDLRKRLDDEGDIALDDDGKPIPGGSAFARPMGQFVIAEVLRTVSINKRSIEDAIDVIMSEISMDIDEAPWVNVIWNPDTQTIQGGKKERGLVVSLINFSLGLKGAPKIRELNKLYREISGDKRAQALPQIEWSGRREAESEAAAASEQSREES